MSNIPFKAALFDLDGTLLDSLHVWTRIDEVFFRARCMPVPQDFGRAIAGKSYRESAQYVVAHYLPDEKWEDIVDEWTRLSELEYARHVRLKPGALGYLRMLRRAGVRLAVTTALPPNLYLPCLEHLGVLELFDALCSTEHTGGRGKESGEVYLLAAERLGVEADACAVFEDVHVGIVGAKNAGMLAYGIRDPHNAKDHPAMEMIADGMIDDWDEMNRYHLFAPSPRCVVFTAYCDGDLREAYASEDGDFVLCADGGWKLAAQVGVKPDRVIGDFDSADAPAAGDVERHPVMKDDTDTMLCLKDGMKRGFERFLFVGGFGGRLDHTLANLQTLAFAAVHGVQAEMCDGVTRAMVVKDGMVRLRRRPGKLSLFAMSDVCRGITSTGTVYNLTDGELTNTFPLGVSNEYAEDEVSISVKDGMLLILQTVE